MIHTQTSCWKINSLRQAPPRRGRERRKHLPSPSETRDPRPERKTRGCMTRPYHEHKTPPFLALP
jgi:hypothetical protein